MAVPSRACAAAPVEPAHPFGDGFVMGMDHSHLRSPHRSLGGARHPDDGDELPAPVIAFSIPSDRPLASSPPSNMILPSLSLFMTFYVMRKSDLHQAWRDGAQPLLANQIDEQQRVERAWPSRPAPSVMTRNTRRKSTKLFVDLAAAGAARLSMRREDRLSRPRSCLHDLGDPARL